MQMLRKLTPEEAARIRDLSTKPTLISDPAYTIVDREKNAEDIKEIEDIMKTFINGFSSFSSFLTRGAMRIQYNWGYGGSTYFIGVGYLTIDDICQGKFTPVNSTTND